MSRDRSSYPAPARRALAVLLFVGAAALVVMSVLFTISVIGTYGRAEGSANMFWQTLPFTLPAVLVAAALVWAGVRLARKPSRPEEDGRS